MKARFFLLLTLLSANVFGDSFSDLWHSMQQVYREFEHPLNYHYCHDYWINKTYQIKAFIFGAPQREFLFYPPIQSTMVRTAKGEMQHYETNYLSKLTSPLKERVRSYRDTQFPSLSLVIPQFKCSVSTLGHLYYFTTVMQHIDKDPEIVMELGGGYGNLARIFTQLCPNCAYIIVDVPELLAIQWLFLKGSSSIDVHVGKVLPEKLTPGVYLIPSGAVKELNVKPSVFISTFALSECHRNLQQDIADKEFFNADMIYLVGGIAGKWREGWVHHDYLIDRIKGMYGNVILEGFQKNPLHTYHSYELFAIN